MKERIEGISVHIVNKETGKLRESNIDTEGNFRVRSLVPGQTYTIKLKIPSDSCFLITSYRKIASSGDGYNNRQ